MDLTVPIVLLLVFGGMGVGLFGGMSAGLGMMRMRTGVRMMIGGYGVAAVTLLVVKLWLT